MEPMSITTEESENRPLAMVDGEPYQSLPEDLYIPPDSLKVFLETFEGPLDLLLYLIKKQNVDIFDIPIAQITQQYVAYIDMISDFRFELASEYLVMAALLAEIKSRMLLPKEDTTEEGEEEDPRAYLIRKLMEYDLIKKAAEEIDRLPRNERDTFIIEPDCSEIDVKKRLPEIDFKELMLAFQHVLQHAEQVTHHHITRETLSIRERMSIILEKLKEFDYLVFSELFNKDEGRQGVVVSFIAILELCKEGYLDISQSHDQSELQVRGIS